MKIYLLYTCDEHKSKSSMRLRGVFTGATKNQIDRAKTELVQYDVITDAEAETYVVETHDGELHTTGGYIS